MSAERIITRPSVTAQEVQIVPDVVENTELNVRPVEQAAESMHEATVSSEEGVVPPRSHVSETQKEAYAFSKEYSREYRTRLAKDLWAIRKRHRVDMPAENEGRAKLRRLLDVKLEEEQERAMLAERHYKSAAEEKTAAETELQLREKEIADIALSLDREKNSILGRIKGWVDSGSAKLTKERTLSLSQLHVDQASEAARVSNIELLRARERRVEAYGASEASITKLWQESSAIQDIVLDESETDAITQKIHEFYGKQLDVRRDWETTQTARSIDKNAREHEVVFLHGLPQGEFMANTADNNPTLNTSGLSARAKADIVMGLEPTISVSTFSPHDEREASLMYSSGLIIGEGTIMSAYEEDAATYAESFDIKFPKYDERAVSSVQPRPIEEISKSIAQEGRNLLPWNEFVVQRPKVAGVFLYKNYGGSDGLAKQLELAEHLGVPLVQIERGKPMRDLLTGEIVNQQMLYDRADACAVEERLQYAEGGINEAYGVPSSEGGVGQTMKRAEERIQRIKNQGSDVPQEKVLIRAREKERAHEALLSIRLRNAADTMLHFNPAARQALSVSGDELFAYLMRQDASYAPFEPFLREKTSAEAETALMKLVAQADTLRARHEGQLDEFEQIAA